MQNKKIWIRSGAGALLWIVILLMALTAATYAWFSGGSVVNVKPMSAAISDKGVDLMISTNRDGNFAETCELVIDGNNAALYPVSTEKTDRFYTGISQNRNGLTILYKDVTEEISKYTIHGRVYLKALNDDCEVYMDGSHTSFGASVQSLAAMRLALKITIDGNTELKILRLDELENTSGAQSKRTVAGENVVVSAIDQIGNATYVNDPCTDIRDFYAQEPEKEDDDPLPGKEKIGFLKQDHIAEIEFWLYLEGCDDQCIDPVQEQEVALQLGFAGITAEDMNGKQEER
ncbi:MAG: hypothetical protein Q4B59_00740 [Lachnospiraceae bacterium]|nr:hypothetical protein [Lachnospiraceae bacterium]